MVGGKDWEMVGRPHEHAPSQVVSGFSQCKDVDPKSPLLQITMLSSGPRGMRGAQVRPSPPWGRPSCWSWCGPFPPW